jgi:hypothetical protein
MKDESAYEGLRRRGKSDKTEPPYTYEQQFVALLFKIEEQLVIWKVGNAYIMIPYLNHVLPEGNPEVRIHNIDWTKE